MSVDDPLRWILLKIGKMPKLAHARKSTPTFFKFYKISPPFDAGADDVASITLRLGILIRFDGFPHTFWFPFLYFFGGI